MFHGLRASNNLLTAKFILRLSFAICLAGLFYHSQSFAQRSSMLFWRGEAHCLVYFTNPGTGAWVVPPGGVTIIAVRAIGGGGGGASGSNNMGGQGGAGGGYSDYFYPDNTKLAASTQVSYAVGSGGAGGSSGTSIPGGNGGDTWFDWSAINPKVLANGGTGGGLSNFPITLPQGQTIKMGGTSDPASTLGSGGGGAAGVNGDGGTGSKNNNNSQAGSGGLSDGDGAGGAAGGYSGVNPVAGIMKTPALWASYPGKTAAGPGGGGGGGWSNGSSTQSGANGGLYGGGGGGGGSYIVGGNNAGGKGADGILIIEFKGRVCR